MSKTLTAPEVRALAEDMRGWAAAADRRAAQAERALRRARADAETWRDHADRLDAIAANREPGE